MPIPQRGAACERTTPICSRGSSTFWRTTLLASRESWCFDELEKSKSHLLIDQMHRYFAQTAVGRHRASRIIPEPFFVHSDLTTGVQIADLVAYVISWGFRMSRMSKPAREELSPFANQIARLRYRAVRERLGNPEFEIWSFAHITDLRTQAEREEGV